MSNTLRVTGLASGLDVDTLVKQMMKAQSMRMDKLKQDRQIVQWKQDSYRDTITDLTNFRNTYLDLLSPADTNMLSSNNYAGFDIAYKDNNTSVTSITAGVGAKTGTYKVSFSDGAVNDGHLASAASVTSSTDFGLETTKETKISDIPGLTFTPGKVTINYTNAGKTDVAEIDITGTNTFNEIIDLISEKTSGNVIASYSQLTGKFSIQTANTGENNTISVSDATGLMGTPVSIIGKDALVYITPPGSTTAYQVKKPSNTFSMDGVTYNLLADKNGTLPAEATLTVTSNADKVFDKIKSFIDKYNELIDKIGKKTYEKKEYSFKPLTDAQKKEMSADEIEKWEEKAKSGILKSDSNLEKMLTSMRQAFFDDVNASGISLSEVGLSTSSNTLDRGKIILEKDSSGEYELKNAIKNNGEKVANLFMKSSDISYDPNHKTDTGRYDEIGIFRRLDDIVKNYVRTSRDDNGKKGILLEISGVKGDLSDISSTLSKELRDNYDKRIKDMEAKLAKLEDTYYKQFSKLEVAMQKMNEQSSWLSQQLGSSVN